MQYTNDNRRREPEKKINFQMIGNIGLAIIAVLIIGNAILIYYLINNVQMIGPQQIAELQQPVENEQEEVDTVANLINTVVANGSTNTTVNSTDATPRKV